MIDKSEGGTNTFGFDRHFDAIGAFLGRIGVLFVVALILLIGSLLRFLQDIRSSLSEFDHHD